MVTELKLNVESDALNVEIIFVLPLFLNKVCDVIEIFGKVLSYISDQVLVYDFIPDSRRVESVEFEFDSV